MSYAAVSKSLDASDVRGLSIVGISGGDATPRTPSFEHASAVSSSCNSRELESSLSESDVEEASAPSRGPPWAQIGAGLVVLIAINAVLLAKQPNFKRPLLAAHQKCKNETVAAAFLTLPGLSWQPYVVMNGVLASIGMLVLGLPADLLLLGLSALFCVLRIITTDELLGGLSNEGVVAVAALCVVSAAIDKTKALDAIMAPALGEPKTIPLAMVKMAMPVVSLGCVFNNTPLVAVMIPIVQSWATRVGIEVSYFMMPLSFIAMLSACLTSMGSSTNLLAVDLLPDAKIGFLDLAPVGFLVMVVGVGYCALAAPYLLPSNHAAPSHEVPRKGENSCSDGRRFSFGAGIGFQDQSARRYAVSFELDKDGPLLNHSLEGSGLLHALAPPGHVILDGQDDELMEPGDELDAVDVTAQDVASLAAIPGLHLKAVGKPHRVHRHARDHIALQNTVQRWGRCALPVTRWVAAGAQGGWAAPHHAFFEVVVPPDGLPVSKLTALESGTSPEPVRLEQLQAWLSESNCTLVAVRGTALKEHQIIPLRGGDVLLIEVLTDDFDASVKNQFAQVTLVPQTGPLAKVRLSPIDRFRPCLAVLGLLFTVLASALHWAPLDALAILVGLVSVVLGTVNVREVYGAINGPVLLTVAASFGLGAAITNTGLAGCLASGIVALVDGSGQIVVVGALVGLASVLGIFVSNNTVIILLAPLIEDICNRQGLNLKTVTLAVIYSANLSFATPFSYQTNMMVMPYGHYVFIDYVKFGVPMMVLCNVVALFGTVAFWG